MKYDPIQIFSRFVKETPEAFRIIGLKKPSKKHTDEFRDGTRSLWGMMTFVLYDIHNGVLENMPNTYNMNILWQNYLRKNGYYDRFCYNEKRNHYVICKRKTKC